MAVARREAGDFENDFETWHGMIESVSQPGGGRRVRPWRDDIHRNGPSVKV